jgi:predicted Zn-dependent peptidase
MDFYGAWLDLSVSMNRSFVSLYSLKKFFAQTLELVQRMLLEPAFSEEQLQMLASRKKAQLKVYLQKGGTLAMRAMRRSIYGAAHPCGMLSDLEDYDRLNPAILRDFYSRHYGSRNCSIYLSGSIDDGVVKLVDEAFGKGVWGSGYAPEERQYVLLPSEERDTVIVKPDAMQGSIRMGRLMMDVKDQDYLPMRVLNTLLGGYFGSRLMKNIREDKGYTYHIASDLATNTSQVLFTIGSEALADKEEEVMEEVRSEMLRLQDEVVSEDELRMVRNYMIGEICRNYEGAFALADAYIFMEHLGLPQTYIEQTIEAVQTTDAARLQQLAQRYFDPDALHTVVVRP